MIIVQAPKEMPPDSFSKSIFLAGPTPREEMAPEWRKECIQLLEAAGYDGVVFDPMNPNFDEADYDSQVGWEQDAMNMADVILFWVHRDMKLMPALTTNVEFGMNLKQGKVVLGYPPESEKMRYLHHMADKHGVPVLDTLEKTVEKAVEMIGQGALRTGGEREIPLGIWKKPAFQEWLQAQKSAGNRLDGAEVVWTFRVGEKKDRLFLWAIHVDVYIESEDRHKINEIVIMRPHISAIVAYCWPSVRIVGTDVRDNIEVAIVKEFRSPASIGDCFIREVPGGSSLKLGIDPADNAVHEFEEETGVSLQADRLEFQGVRQIAGTLSTHHAHVYSVALTIPEMATMKREIGKMHGVVEDTEQTYVEVYTVAALLKEPLTDWATLGMIMAALPADVFHHG